MAHPAHGWPDWREEDQYAGLLEADRAAFAWEWLRRMSGYRAAWADAGGCAGGADEEERAAGWGLHRFESPGLPAPLARPLWRRDLFPAVLEAVAEPPGSPADHFYLARFASIATLYRSSMGKEHLLLSDGLRSIRLDVVGGTVLAGPVRLQYRLSGFAAIAGPLLVLRRLAALVGTGRFSTVLHPREARARRWVTMLRAHDALAAGATQREIAENLLSREAAAPRWRIAAPTIRSRVQRLTRAAREMGGSGYLGLLQGEDGRVRRPPR